MNILFIHQNFPGQFKNLAPALVKRGHTVSAIVLNKTTATHWEGVRLIQYGLNRVNAKDGHPWAVDFESKVIRGEACLNAAITLKQGGYSPDVIVAHPGWGESLFLKEVWPDANLKLYCEFYYHARGADVGFDPEFSSYQPAETGRVLLKNANLLIQFQQADAGLSPTEWQASIFPEHIRKKITVIHDGIDTSRLRPNPTARFTLGGGEVVTCNDEIVTFVNRALEPYRGFHTFMRSLPKILSERPNAKVLIVGKEGISYGAQPPEGTTWKKIFTDEVFPGMCESQRSRVHFLNHIKYDQFISLLQVSTVHVYLTYPFVLSWSLLEAMSIGCSIVASDTPPVREAIKHEENGLLVDFFKPQELAASVISLLAKQHQREIFASNARKFAQEHYDLHEICLPQQMHWLEA